MSDPRDGEDAGSGGDEPTGRSARLDELVARLVDGSLAPGEIDELATLEARMTSEDPEALARASALLEIEGGLRRLRAGDVSGAVVASLSARQGASLDRVMESVTRQAPDVEARWRANLETRRRAKRTRWLGVGLGLLGAAAFAWFAGDRRAPETTPAEAPTAELLDLPAPGPEAAPPRFAPALDPAAPRTPAPQPAPEPRTIFSYDFEDGQVPAGLDTAAVAPGPERGNNRFVAVGGLSRIEPNQNLIKIDPDRDGHPYAVGPGSVLGFDYFAGADTGGFVVQLFNKTQRRNFSVRMRPVPRTQWAHMTLRLSDLIGSIPPLTPPDPGDRMGAITIVGGKFPGGGLFVDNLRLLEYPAGVTPPLTGITTLTE
jgi:hypothetical protein